MMFRKILILKIQQLAASILYLSLIISVTTLFIYLLDRNYSDRLLFFLLIVLRYSSFILGLCSLYKVFMNVYHFFRRPSLLRAIKIVFYLVIIVYTLVIILFETLISVVAGGNL